ncbi:MAG: hypothetical protein JRG91_14180 [Deltaproteobacteria bacterium]|nr:hypothetical protein [Deltaproteobacteria bacterium]
MRTRILAVVLAGMVVSCAAGEVCTSGYFDCGGICVDLLYDSTNCGSCGVACDEGQVCENGACILSCLEGYTDCSGTCRDLMTDDYNCGSCGFTCAAGYACVDGSCAPDCPDGYTECSGTCKNLSNDPSNCGDCGNVCAAGEVCLTGACSFECPSPYIDCSGSCADLDVDHGNCGSCGNVCNSGQICVAGSCENSCLEGLTLCSGVCRDLMRDPANCGSCANSCDSDAVCEAGACVLACTSGFTDCSSSCRDLMTDRMNCGACDNVCDVAEVCNAGVCTFMCLSPLTDCSGVCTHLDDDPDNCGTCGAACNEMHATAYCVSGACGLICHAGFEDCDVDVTTGCEADLLHDTSNCGSCGVVCATDEVCLSGTCSTRVGFTGATGTTWASVPSGSGGRGLQAWVPLGETYMYYGTGTSFGRHDISAGTWATRASPPSSLAGWGSPALANGYIWELRPPNVLRYDPSANTWSTVRTDLHAGDEQAMTVTDDAGHIWSYNALTELIEYDPIADTVTYHMTGITTYDFETRLGYDELTNSIYFGGFSGGGHLYRWDISTSTLTALATHPEGALNDIFCADHWGHIYAAGGSSGTTIWQYDIATDAWARIPDWPISHGVNGSCSVHESGWLYMEPGSLSTVYKIELY